jgi:hypothetical protein
MAEGANNPANGKLIKGAGSGTREWREDFVLTDTDGVTPLFKIAKADGAMAAKGVSAGSLAASGLITSTVAAGSPVVKAILTNATPTVVFGADASHNPSTAPAGFLQILVGSTTYYIPVWA